LAKSGEILVGEDLFEALPPERRKVLVEISPVRLKGVETEMRIFSRQVERPGGVRTVMLDAEAFRQALPKVDARFAHAGSEWALDFAERLTVGRSDENDLVVADMSVSRQHGTIAVNNGLVEYADHSSAGSYVRMDNGEELSVFRRALVLSGSGSIALGAPHQEAAQQVIRFRIVTSRA
jgi:hypothetical protein